MSNTVTILIHAEFENFESIGIKIANNYSIIRRSLALPFDTTIITNYDFVSSFPQNSSIITSIPPE
jgi:hypothetical protein